MPAFRDRGGTSLWRRAHVDQPTAAFILINPSTADHAVDDPTSRNCHRSAAKLGLGIQIVNIFPWRGDPDSLLAAGEQRYGDRDLNEEHIRHAIRRAKLVVLGFGDFENAMRPLRPDVERFRNLLDQERAAGHLGDLYYEERCPVASSSPLQRSRADTLQHMATMAHLNPPLLSSPRQRLCRGYSVSP